VELGNDFAERPFWFYVDYFHDARMCSNILAYPQKSIVPKGPRGEKRPADVIGNAVHVMRLGG
jgi:hypothetical protein